MWLRIVEVPAALQARSYDAEASAVIQIRDDFCPWNQVCYKLIVSPDRSICQPTTQASDLGAVYLGGTSLETLMRTGGFRSWNSELSPNWTEHSQSNDSRGWSMPRVLPRRNRRVLELLVAAR